MSDEKENEALRETLDLDAWEPQMPPADFAERVLAKVRKEEVPTKVPARSNRRWGYVGGAAAAIAIAAAVVLKVGSAPPSHGEAIAKDRIEVNLGTRARAVLEPGAEVAWNGNLVEQTQGDVFYRVEPGARFRVHTPAGDVEVKGTCFTVKVTDMQKRDVKAGVIGAGLSALAFVAVYEGKVAVSHASQHVALAAGESAVTGPDGVRTTGALGEGSKNYDAKVAEAADGDPLSKANQNLVQQVDEYRRRLEAIAQQKSDLEAKLKKSEASLAATTDGSAPRTRSEFDLDKDDWAQLAKEGTVKYRSVCGNKDLWNVAPDKLNKVGLAPTDAPVMRDAYEKSAQRTWAQIKPLCAQALGITGDVLDKIGANSCSHLIYDVAFATDRDAAMEAQTEAAEVRAGLRPEPGPNDKVNPVERMFLAQTGANLAFEADLAKSLGPEEAHRLAYSSDLCGGTSVWGGGKKRGGDDDK